MAPCLTYPNPLGAFCLYTDASGIAIRAALMQEEDDTKKSVSFASHTLKPLETQYSAHEQKLLAVIFAVKKF